jgi:hypothetical protein
MLQAGGGMLEQLLAAYPGCRGQRLTPSRAGPR